MKYNHGYDLTPSPNFIKDKKNLVEIECIRPDLRVVEVHIITNWREREREIEREANYRHLI